MTRLLGLALCASLIVLVLVTAFGRAIDTEVRDRVIFTRSGVTLDCARQFDSGSVGYVDCHEVP